VFQVPLVRDMSRIDYPVVLQQSTFAKSIGVSDDIS
jgi:hypothetical protein